MNLIEESFQNKNTKKKDSKALITTIVVFMVIVFILILGILGYLAYIEQSKLVLTLNNQVNEKVKGLLLIEEDGSIYLPVKQIASYFGYESFNGEYTDKSESQSKCYVQSENEVTNVTLGSNKLYKLDLTKNSQDYSYVYAKQAIKSINGVLYASSDTAEEIFNISFNYDKEKNRIDIYTIPFLVEAYSKVALDNGYAELSDTFVNQKAILKEVLVVSNKKENEQPLYGVLDLDGKVILEAKYDNIEYLQESGDFLVKSNNKVGIISKNRDIKVQIAYDDIKLIDSDAQLYIVKRDNKYGVIDFKGNTKIYIEQEEIGVDISKYSENGIKNKYLLADNLIPVKKDKFWAIYNKKGEQLTEYKYDNIGCTPTNSRSAQSSLLVIPDYNVLVVEKDKKYTLLNSDGEELFGTIIADSIYMEITGGEKYYYIVVGENRMNAIDYLKQRGVKAKNESADEDKEQDESKNTNSTNNNSTNTTTNTNSSSKDANTNTTRQNVNNEDDNNEQDIDEQNQEEQNNNENE